MSSLWQRVHARIPTRDMRYACHPGNVCHERRRQHVATLSKLTACFNQQSAGAEGAVLLRHRTSSLQLSAADAEIAQILNTSTRTDSVYCRKCGRKRDILSPAS